MLCDQYFGKFSGEMFVDFMHRHFKETLEKQQQSK